MTTLSRLAFTGALTDTRKPRLSWQRARPIADRIGEVAVGAVLFLVAILVVMEGI